MPQPQNNRSTDHEPPEQLARAMGEEVEVDVAKRILKRAVFMTRMVASDGGIVIPEGINAKFWGQDPVVLAKHNMTWEESKSNVIGRSLSLGSIADGMEAAVQFADTEFGRDYAYLYGVNEEREVYARGWSFSWTTLENTTWTVDEARAWVGEELWDDDLVPGWARREDAIWVSKRSLMHEFSCVELGADKLALSRAFNDKGIRAAGNIITTIDLNEASTQLSTIRAGQKETDSQVKELEGKILALSSDGSAAAARGDTAEILQMVSELRDFAAERGLVRDILSLRNETRRR